MARKAIMTYSGNHFVGEVIHLSNNRFENCVFERCQMIESSPPGQLDRCHFKDCSLAIARDVTTQQEADELIALINFFKGAMPGASVSYRDPAWTRMGNG
jgi:hypothetical protein